MTGTGTIRAKKVRFTEDTFKGLNKVGRTTKASDQQEDDGIINLYIYLFHPSPVQRRMLPNVTIEMMILLKMMVKEV